MTSLSRKLAAEAVGTAFLLVAVVGSGIMGETLADGNLAITLLANSLATGAALIALPIVETSTRLRGGLNLGWSEFVASFGLLTVILSGVKWRPEAMPYAVGAYITGAYWFTASTSFANPAVTLARAATDTFAGIHPANVPGFIAAQVLGAGAAIAFFGWLLQKRPIGERS